MGAWSGLFDDVQIGGHSLIASRNTLKTRLSRVFRRNGARELKEKMLTLNGATAGSAMSATHVKVQAEALPGEISGGGVRTIETVTDATGNTTAAHKTEIDDILNADNKPVYVADLAGHATTSQG